MYPSGIAVLQGTNGFCSISSYLLALMASYELDGCMKIQSRAGFICGSGLDLAAGRNDCRGSAVGDGDLNFWRRAREETGEARDSDEGTMRCRAGNRRLWWKDKNKTGVLQEPYNAS